MRILRILHEWPLSKVELVEINGKKYILKTIHKDFVAEIYRQKILLRNCRKISIPKIYFVKKGKKVVSFLMEYVSHRYQKPDKKILSDVIRSFHDETRNLRSKHFAVYNFDSFYRDFIVARKYIKSSFGIKSRENLKEFFKSVFDSEYSVVHGDWGHDQILGKQGKYYVVDFGKSYYGPSIIDYYNVINDWSEIVVKAKLIFLIKDIVWLDLCKRKYIKYDYKKEIASRIREIDALIKKIM